MAAVNGGAGETDADTGETEVAGETEAPRDRWLFVEAWAASSVADWVIRIIDGGIGVRGDSVWFAFFFLPFFFADVKGVLPS